MTEIKDDTNREYWMNIYLQNIKNGTYTFRDVREWKMKDEIRDKLLKEVEAGTASEITINALVTFQVDMIKRDRIDIEDVHPLIRDKVKEALDNGKQ